MSKFKTRALGLIVALAMFLTAAAQIALISPAGSALAETSPVMSDPVFQMISLAEDDVLTLQNDDTVHGVVHPTAGYGGRAVANGLGDRMRYTVEDGVKVELRDLTVNKEGRFFVTMQTVPTGTMGPGNGGGVHVGFDVTYYANHGKCFFHLMVYNTDTTVGWVPLELPLDNGDSWHADTVTIKFTNHSISVKCTGATTGDFDKTLTDSEASFENLCIDFNDSTRQYYNPQAYLSFDCYNPNLGQTRGAVTFDLVSVNDKAPGAVYKEALAAQTKAFLDAVAAAEADSSNQEKIAAAVALNTFGSDEGYGKLLAQFGTADVKTQVAAAREKIIALNGDQVFAALKEQIENYIAKLDAYDLDDAATHTAAAEEYNKIDWSQYDILNDGFKAQIDELVAAMKEKTFFKSSVFDVADAHVTLMETATAAEFASSQGYIDVAAKCDGWTAYKTVNFVGELADGKISALDARVAAVKAKIETSFYHKFIYRGTESEVKLYDEGLYLSVKPDVYPNTDNAVSFREKMTLGENSEFCFNLIYGLRKLGAFQMQIGFYPVAGATTKGGTDGVRVDFWLSEAGITEVKPVNGKDETDAITGGVLSLTDEEFFDFKADKLDYTKSDYAVKLDKRDDGSLFVTVNGMEIDITGAGLNAELFKDGVYVTVTGVGYNGTANNELLVTKVGSTEYADIFEKEKPDDNNHHRRGCGGAVVGASLAGALALVSGSGILLKKKKK